MKVVVCLLVFLVYSSALPTEIEINWSNVSPNKVYVEPLNSVRNKIGLRVTGGTEVTPNSIPYQVAVIVNGDSLCGGALISTTSVLTVAHCTISASFVQVRLGAHQVSSEEATQVRVTSTSIKNHQNYVSPVIANNIAVILLPAAVVLNNNIGIIPLPPVDYATYEGRTGLLTGWGTTSGSSDIISPVLLGVNVTIIDYNACRNIFGSIVQINNVCTSGEGGVGACDGDAGSPLVVDDLLIGIMSFAVRQCDAGYPTVFTRINFFRDWIETYAGV